MSEPTPFLRDEAEKRLRAGDVQGAQGICRAHLDEHPQDIDALLTYAQSTVAANDFRGTIATCQTILDIDPDCAIALFEKGNAHRELGQLDQAAEALERASELAPKADHLNNLGSVRAMQGDLAAAGQAFAAAVAQDPNNESAQINLVRVFFLQRDPQKAIDTAHQALGKHQQSHRLFQLLGDIWLEIQVLPNAVTCYERALEFTDNPGPIHNKLGVAHTRLSAMQEAQAHFEAAARLGSADAYSYANLAEVCRRQRDLKGALAWQRQALAERPELAEVHSSLLLNMLHDEDVTGEALRAEAERWHAQHAQGITPLLARPREAAGPIRVGYVSGALYHHPIGRILEAVLSQHDREHFQTHCYACQEFRDETTQRLQDKTDVWREAHPLDDRALATQIREDGIDVLVDLCGHARPNRLLAFAYRPAPVQLAWLGYPSTTGLPDFDGVLGDEVVTPACDQPHFSERIVTLPGHYLCFAPPSEEVACDRATQAGPFTFGSLHDLAEINTRVLETWAEILQRTEETQLFLKSPARTDERTRDEVLEIFAKRSVSPDRLQLEGQDRRDGLAAYRQIDLVLDPFPVHASYAALESLWMGVPFVTHVGQRFAARGGRSLLQAMGLEHLIASSREEYCERAIAAADNLWTTGKREALRETFLASPLCHTERFTAQLESTFRQLLTTATPRS